MTTLEPSPQTGLLPMELPSMSSAAGSRVRTSARQGIKLELQMEPAAACGRKLSDFVANFDPPTFSWKTSQRCLLTGWAEFSETWPRSGMMRNGIAYRLPPLVPLTSGTASGSSHTWPTPAARDGKGGYIGGRMRNGKISRDTLDVAVQWADNQLKTGGQLNPTWVEWLMGFPIGHTDLKG